MVQHASREDMSAALDTLVRQCDARLPMLPPSLTSEPLTVPRVDLWTREEGVIAARRGPRVQVIARRLRNAIWSPRCASMEQLVSAWLPDEDALRWVVVATRDAVFRWCSAPGAPLFALLRIGALVAREERGATLTVLECALAAIAQLGAEDEARALTNELVAQGAASIGEVVRRARVMADRVLAALGVDELSLNRREAVLLLQQCFETIERGDEDVVQAYDEAAQWFAPAAIVSAVNLEAPVIRRRFHELDLERLLVDADARDALALASQEKAPQ